MSDVHIVRIGGIVERGATLHRASAAVREFAVTGLPALTRLKGEHRVAMLSLDGFSQNRGLPSASYVGMPGPAFVRADLQGTSGRILVGPVDQLSAAARSALDGALDSTRRYADSLAQTDELLPALPTSDGSYALRQALHLEAQAAAHGVEQLGQFARGETRGFTTSAIHMGEHRPVQVLLGQPRQLNSLSMPMEGQQALWRSTAQALEVSAREASRM